MSRKSNEPAISYAAVVNACAELIKQGDKPSLRKLREQLGGGSLSTIHPHYHRWQDEQRHSQKADADLSDTFRQAVLAEIGRATATLEKNMTEDLGVEKERLREAQALLLECETKIEKLKEDSEANQKAAEQKCLKLERELTIAKALAEDNAKREKEYQHQIETLRQEAQKAELKSAVSETKLTELEKQLNRYASTQKPVE